MSDYRDFIDVTSKETADAYANNAAYVDTTKKGLVYMATHKGEQRLPFMNRSFISFSYGGKNIEDFNLIATTENNRLNRYGSSEFEDLVDAYNILDGQFYWGTHFKPNKFTFKLATDGITQLQLDEFKYWFLGGKTRELILAEHPNRAIMARVSVPPNILLLPFEQPTTVMVSGRARKTSTTLYKGEITVDFVMDLPFWYSKINIFGYYDEISKTYKDTWVDANGNPINVYDEYNKRNIDVMKIVLEDNIPVSSMITIDTLLGNNTFANLSTDSGGHIALANDEFIYLFSTTIEDENEQELDAIGILIGQLNIMEVSGYTYGEPEYLYPTLLSLDDNIKTMLINLVNEVLPAADTLSEEVSIADLYTAINNNFTLTEAILPDKTTNLPQQIIEHADAYARIYDDEHENEEEKIGLAIIHGPAMAEDTGVSEVEPNTTVHFYYAGTAPAQTEMSFILTPEIRVVHAGGSDRSNYYISTPANSYASTIIREGKLIPYNTITITSLTDKEFRFSTPSIYTAYNEAIKIFINLSNYANKSWEEIRQLIRDNVKHYAVRAWAIYVIDAIGDSIIDIARLDEYLNNMVKLFKKWNIDNGFSDHELYDIECNFDGKNGKSTGKFKYNVATKNGSTWAISVAEKEEDISDMLKSNYLIITDRNHPDERGNIVARLNVDNDYVKTYCHDLIHDITGGLKNLYLRYLNMYL